MPRALFDPSVSISLLDRLTDREPNVKHEPPPSRAQTVRQLRAALRRDLEWLFNARRTPIEPPDDARELRRSVFWYGLPDITGVSVDSDVERAMVARAMEVAIETFEPRLAQISVTVQDLRGPARVLRFRIEAMLLIEPAPERISFDTALHLTSSQYEVEGQKIAG